MYEFAIGLGWGVARSTCRAIERMAADNGCAVHQDPPFLKMAAFQLVTFRFEGGDQEGIQRAIEMRWPKPSDGQKAIDTDLARRLIDRRLIDRGVEGLGHWGNADE